MSKPTLHPEVQAIINEHNEHLEGPDELFAKVYQLGLSHGSRGWYGLSDATTRRLDEWVKEQNAKVAKQQGKPKPYYGAIGGAYVYSTCPTTLGMTIRVTNEVTKEEIDLSDYSDW